MSSGSASVLRVGTLVALRRRRRAALGQVPGLERAPHASPPTSHKMKFVLVRNAVGAAAERRGAGLLAERLAEHGERRHDDQR